jgi:hypothetical protein
MRRRHFLIAAFVTVTGGGLWLSPRAHVAAQSLPSSISDRDFWAMVTGFSESGGYFRSDNLISNEMAFQQVIPDLQKTPRPGAYLGVGPDQNFTYITALRPKMAFIVDIRRQNMLLHLMYKALVELSSDRVDFLSRLFSRPRPEGLGPDASLQALFDAFEALSGDEMLVQKNLKAVFERLERTHGFPLTEEDENAIKFVYTSFYLGGPDIRYSFPRSDFGGPQWFPTYAELMVQTDLRGENHSYIATEQNFAVLREYERNNLIVPLVGDFAGDHALRTVGRYLKDHDATVTSFYTSNVEQYLFRSGVAPAFYQNVATLPIDDRSVFIRSAAGNNVIDSISGLLKDFSEGRITVYGDVTIRGSR